MSNVTFRDSATLVVKSQVPVPQPAEGGRSTAAASSAVAARVDVSYGGVNDPVTLRMQIPGAEGRPDRTVTFDFANVAELRRFMNSDTATLGRALGEGSDARIADLAARAGVDAATMSGILDNVRKSADLKAGLPLDGAIFDHEPAGQLGQGLAAPDIQGRPTVSDVARGQGSSRGMVGGLQAFLNQTLHLNPPLLQDGLFGNETRTQLLSFFAANPDSYAAYYGSLPEGQRAGLPAPDRFSATPQEGRAALFPRNARFSPQHVLKLVEGGRQPATTAPAGPAPRERSTDARPTDARPTDARTAEGPQPAPEGATAARRGTGLSPEQARAEIAEAQAYGTTLADANITEGNAAQLGAALYGQLQQLDAIANDESLPADVRAAARGQAEALRTTSAGKLAELVNDKNHNRAVAFLDGMGHSPAARTEAGHLAGSTLVNVGAGDADADDFLKALDGQKRSGWDVFLDILLEIFTLSLAKTEWGDGDDAAKDAEGNPLRLTDGSFVKGFAQAQTEDGRSASELLGEALLGGIDTGRDNAAYRSLTTELITTDGALTPEQRTQMYDQITQDLSRVRPEERLAYLSALTSPEGQAARPLVDGEGKLTPAGELAVAVASNLDMEHTLPRHRAELARTSLQLADALPPGHPQKGALITRASEELGRLAQQPPRGPELAGQVIDARIEAAGNDPAKLRQVGALSHEIYGQMGDSKLIDNYLSRAIQSGTRLEGNAREAYFSGLIPDEAALGTVSAALLDGTVTPGERAAYAEATATVYRTNPEMRAAIRSNIATQLDDGVGVWADDNFVRELKSAWGDDFVALAADPALRGKMIGALESGRTTDDEDAALRELRLVGYIADEWSSIGGERPEVRRGNLRRMFAGSRDGHEPSAQEFDGALRRFAATLEPTERAQFMEQFFGQTVESRELIA